MLSFDDESWGGSYLVSSLSGLATDRAGQIWLTHNGSYPRSSYTYDLFWYNNQGVHQGAWDRVVEGGAIAVANDGAVFIVDTVQEVILKLTSFGERDVQWGSDRNAPGWFQFPYDVVTDDAGAAYVTDYASSRVEVFGPDGTFRREWYSPIPLKLGIGPQGNVYVSRELSTSLYQYTAEGVFVSVLNLPFEIWSLDVGLDGHVYVGGPAGQFAKLLPDGNLVSQWQGNRVTDLAVATDGYIFALGSDSPHVAKYSAVGDLVDEFEARSGVAIEVDSEGVMYIVSGNIHSSPPYALIARYSPDGESLGEWGKYGTADGEFKGPAALAFCPDSSVLVVDSWNRRVERFTRDGSYLSKFGNDPTLDGKFQRPADLDMDSRGNVYVADDGNNRIQKFTSEGLYLHKWGRMGSMEGEFNSPRGIALDDEDQVYVWDTGNGRVQVFDEDGTFLRMWSAVDSSGALVPWSAGLVGIDTDHDGNVYLVDAAGNRVVKFSPDGIPLFHWGVPGSGPGEFQTPRNVTVDSSGNIFVTDMVNKRVQKFSYVSP